ncbi:TPA: O-antigen ligase family protein [Vibrio vulnificus]
MFNKFPVEETRVRLEYLFSSLPIFWLFTGHLWFKDSSKTLVVITVLFLLTSVFFCNFQIVKNNLKSRKFLWVIFCVAAYGVISKEIHGYSNKELRVLFCITIYFSLVSDRFITFTLSKIHWLLFLASTTTLVYSIFQTYILDVERRLWPLNPIPLTTVSAGVAVCALAYLFKSKEPVEKTVLSITLLFGLSTILISETRSSLLALFAGGFIILCLQPRKAKIKPRTIFYVILAVLIIGFTLKDSVQSRYHSTLDEIESIKSGNLNTSIGFRFQLWESTLHTPISLFGLGDEHISFRESLYQSKIIEKSAVYWDHYHNQFLTSLYIYGVIGLMSIISLLVIPLIFITKNTNKEPIIALVVVYFISSLTDIPFNQSISLGFYLAMTLIILNRSIIRQGRSYD